MGRLRGKCGKTLGICRAPPAPGIVPSRSAPPAPPCARHPRGKSPIAWFTLLQSVPNILPPEPIINKESSIGIGSTSLPSLRNYAALSRSFLGQIRFQNRPCALPRRRGNVVTGAWQRCYGGVATLLWRRGNVVMEAWQRCYGGVATRWPASRSGKTPCKHDKAPSALREAFVCLLFPRRRLYFLYFLHFSPSFCMFSSSPCSSFVAPTHFMQVLPRASRLPTFTLTPCAPFLVRYAPRSLRPVFSLNGSHCTEFQLVNLS